MLFSDLRVFVNQFDQKLWVGLNDRGMEGVFRLNDDTKYDPNHNENNLYEWKSGEPNNVLEEDCVQIGDDRHLNDEDCGAQFYGLCEIKVYNC